MIDFLLSQPSDLFVFGRNTQPVAFGQHHSSRADEITIAMAEDNAKLSSLFNKKKKKSTTVNANVIAKEQSRAETAAAVAKSAASVAAAAARPQSPKARAKGVKGKPATSSPAGGPSAAPIKNLSELALGEKDEKSAFQWAKQPKKYKDTTDSKVINADELRLIHVGLHNHSLISCMWTQMYRRAWRARGRSRTRATARRARST